MTTMTEHTGIRSAWKAADFPDDSLQPLRSKALEAFVNNGFPDKRNERWRYTNVRALAEAFPEWGEPHGRAGRSNITPLEIDGVLHLQVIDGVVQLPDEPLPAGARIASIADLSRNEPEVLENRLGTLAVADDSAFVALNTAFAADGIALLLDDDTELAQKICITHVSTRARTRVQPRLLVIAGARSRATLVEHFVSEEAAIVNPVAEVFCAEQSRFDYYKLQTEHTDSWHTAAFAARVGQDAAVHVTSVDAGGQLARSEFRIDLAGRGAHAEAKGLFMADGKRHAEARIDVNHLAPDTTSRERYRGILAELGKGVFNGRIYVAREAQKTNAELTNRNLLLSRGAEINTKPELEIYADDVKCAHGSTTGQLDANSLFYLLSRGVDETTARSLLVTAFAAELLTDITVPAIAEQARLALEALRARDEVT